MTTPAGDATGHAMDYGASLPPGARAPASYAASAVPSRGRLHPEPDCPTRSPFQRDRDRILHASAFRRLTYKTQVFVFHEGDHYRTRLTHSLEVAQIARTIARQLCLDEDLAETLALAHDLGHSPFGHAGERALDDVLKAEGGFDHNAQSIRVVTALERRYAAFDGLNLTWETLEGLAKHNGPITDPATNPVAKVLDRLSQWQDFDFEGFASAEAQVAALSDDIAYVNHDIDDALRAGLLAVDDLRQTPLAGPVVERALSALDGVTADHARTRTIYEITRRMITAMVFDVVTEARRAMTEAAVASPGDIRRAGRPLVAFSPGMRGDVAALKRFLFARVYRHERVMRVMTAAESIVRDLFQRYVDAPHEMQADWSAVAARQGDKPLARLVGDFVAGMTDRFAIAEHRRLFDATPELR